MRRPGTCERAGKKFVDHAPHSGMNRVEGLLSSARRRSRTPSLARSYPPIDFLWVARSNPRHRSRRMNAGRPPTDVYLQFYTTAMAIRPIVRSALERGETFDMFLPRVVAELRRSYPKSS